MSQAAAEGFIESDSESDSDNEGADDSTTNIDDIDIFEESMGDGNTVGELQNSTSAEPRSKSSGSLLDYFSSSRKNAASPNAQGTLDKFFGLSKKAASAPIATSNTNVGQKPSSAKKAGSAGTKTPWFARPPVHKDSAPFYKRIPETTYLVDDFRFIYKDPPTKYVAFLRKQIMTHTSQLLTPPLSMSKKLFSVTLPRRSLRWFEQQI